MKTNKILKIAGMILFFGAIIYTPHYAFAKKQNRAPKFEGDGSGMTTLTSPLESGTKQETTTMPSAPAQFRSLAAPSALTVNTVATNLIANPSFENVDANGNPVGWSKGGYGSNTRVLTFPGPANTGSNGAKITISNVVSGDAKWFFNDVSVEPGVQYEFSDYSLATVPTIIDVRYKKSDGTFVYKDIANVPASSAYRKNTVTITIPPDVVSLTIFHLINQTGEVSVDDYSLAKVESTPTPSPAPSPSPAPQNLVPNGNFESASTGSTPVGWSKGGWGTNTRIFVFPASGSNGSNGAEIQVTNYVSGDAKWFFTPISLGSGTYTYSDEYKSNIGSTITVQYQNNDGTFSYKDIKTLPAASQFTKVTVDFSVGANIKSVTIFHLIQNNGTLAIDNVSVVKKAETSGIFTTGAVTLRFDDGWLSQYQNAVPKLVSAGVKGTFFIVSQQMSDQGYTGFMSIANVRELFGKGFEIGAHTRTHPFLTTLDATAQQDEILGSRNDMLSWGGVGSVTSFAYPYGDYNTTTLGIVKNAGFSDAAATLTGNVTPTSDKYQLQNEEPLIDTSLSQVESWIDNAIANKQWLILTFHQINNDGTQYSITPQTFNSIVDYIVSKHIKVITVGEGISSLQ
jgi:peptidoglycan/xylan/chitin deacetylase (PgdA/CDA1 family)